MQSIKTILLFEVMYRHNILGLPLDEIENQLKNYPTQDAEDLVSRLRKDIATDTLSRGPESEDDVSVSEAQEQGGKAEYQAHFNKMLKAHGASNISDLKPEQRKDFFNKIDKHWKSKKESKKVSEEIAWDGELFEEFSETFKDYRDIIELLKEEIKEMEIADILNGDDIVEEAVDNIIKEAGKRTTITKISRQTKIDRAMGNLAMQYAKATGDPMYKKFKKFKDKWMKYKERIQSKYGPRVRTAARQGGGIQPMLAKVGKDRESQKKKEKK